jgi:Icc protein
MKNTLNKAVLLASLLTVSCEHPFGYNPNEIILEESERDLNAKSIQRIQAIPTSDTLKFILMGDTQRWYDESEDFVKSANNQRGISFVLHAGDISDFGLSQEFKWVNEIMVRLKYPYLTVIGNHDTVANGEANYRRMYGALNYSFDYAGHRFIFINTNSREYAFDGTTPDLVWLKSQLASPSKSKKQIVIAHVPPYDGDFDKNLEKKYAQVLSESKIAFSLYGHQHAFKEGEYYHDGVTYYQTTNVGARGYLVITSWKNGYKVDRIEY